MNFRVTKLKTVLALIIVILIVVNGSLGINCEITCAPIEYVIAAVANFLYFGIGGFFVFYVLYSVFQKKPLQNA